VLAIIDSQGLALIPALVLAEILVIAGDAGPDYLDVITDNAELKKCSRIS
jgi:hypothetical protein